MNGTRTCSVSGCFRDSRSRFQPLCDMHYQRVRAHGCTGDALSRSERRTTCSVESCVRDMVAGSLCDMHYKRRRRHGSPEVVIDQSARQKKGRDSSSWTEAPTYFGAHRRTRRVRGSAAAHVCTRCPKQAREWAYDHADPNEVIDDQGLRYSTDPTHYVPMCFSCHRMFDRREPYLTAEDS